ncbi:C2H2-type domain-containing protein [Plasmodiophora brassicae]|uniref:C2H2-type domain-containing protein n=1 Tax=Plasmodiophora brassicae TaxID=37360 RepID=A0A0G4IT36_PLABS|nr:hypothetical protein PBRA_006501 [Plasmodiophora brassicae]SPQ94472.1 unnamed protein product [Plasmodiophora brassicae]
MGYECDPGTLDGLAAYAAQSAKQEERPAVVLPPGTQITSEIFASTIAQRDQQAPGSTWPGKDSRCRMVGANGQVQYVCSVCNKPFTQMGSLVIHYRLHSGERPFDCEFCDRKFTQSSHCKSHMKRIHGSTYIGRLKPKTKSAPLIPIPRRLSPAAAFTAPPNCEQ